MTMPSQTNSLSRCSSGSSNEVSCIDIVIVNWNSGVLLQKCIAALDRSTVAGKVRIVIVDNASVDGSVDRLSATRLEVVLLRNDTNVGFAAASNVGAARCDAEYIVFLNPDVRVRQDTLSRILEFLNDNSNTAVGVVGIQLVDGDDCIQRTCARKPTVVALLLRALFLDRVVPWFVPSHFLIEWDHGDTRQVDQVMGACLVVRRAAFLQIGGFDQRYFLYYEDLDLCLTAWSTGWKVTYFPGAVAEHTGGGSTGKIKCRRIFYLACSRLKYTQKWHGSLAAMLLGFFTLFVEIPARLGVLALRQMRSKELP
jgi:hypothetical protein